MYERYDRVVLWSIAIRLGCLLVLGAMGLGMV